MSITDELREWAKGSTLSKWTLDKLLAIADRIDVEHDREMIEIRTRGWNNGYDEGFASADDWLAHHEDVMAEHGWVRKDKEHIISHATIEVTPHIDWSRMADELNEFVGHSSTRTNGLKLRRTQLQFTDEQQRFIDEHYQLLPVDADGVPIHVGDVMDGTCPSGKHVNGTVNAIGDGVFWLSNVQFSLKPNYMHHHHAPTVEDVLREFFSRYVTTKPKEDDDAILAEFAAKLRLASNEE